MSLARWIMDRATDNPPRGREDWAAAMRAEFETLEASRLGWALGCWRTMAGWRLQADWLFLLGLVAVPLLVVGYLSPMSSFALALVLPDPLYRAIFFPMGFLGLATGAALLTLWRPDRIVTASVMVCLIALFHGLFVLRLRIGSDSLDRWELYNAPPLVGGLAMLAACWIGASVGAWIRRRLQSRRRLSAT